MNYSNFVFPITVQFARAGQLSKIVSSEDPSLIPAESFFARNQFFKKLEQTKCHLQERQSQQSKCQKRVQYSYMGISDTLACFVAIKTTYSRGKVSQPLSQNPTLEHPDFGQILFPDAKKQQSLNKSQMHDAD